MSGKPGIHRKTISQNLITRKLPRSAFVKGNQYGKGKKGYKADKSKTSSTQFRDDLFWVYKEYGGRKQLLDLIKNDADMRKHFLKSLIQVYGKELDMQLKKMNLQGAFDGGGGKNFIFIMDGLDRKNGKVIGGDSQSLPMQILNQMINVDQKPIETDGEDKETVGEFTAESTD